jgi:putative sporulation protein YtaF
MRFFYVLLLGFAVSLDSFAAGVAYGLKNIRVTVQSLVIVGLITAVSTSIAMFCAGILEQYIDVHIAVLSGSFLLVCLGGISLFQEYLTKNVSAYEIDGEITAGKLTFSVGKLVISIIVRPETADIDHSKSISALEAIFLGLALGVDNLVATFAASLMGVLPLYTPILMALIQMAFIVLGSLASTHLVSDSWKHRFPYLPGTILILIGLIRLQ